MKSTFKGSWLLLKLQQTGLVAILFGLPRKKSTKSSLQAQVIDCQILHARANIRFKLPLMLPSVLLARLDTWGVAPNWYRIRWLN